MSFLHTVTTSGQRLGRTGPLLSVTAAALVVAFGTLVPASHADATVVYSGPVSIVAPVTTSGIYINVVTGATGTSGSGTAGWDVNVWGTSSLRIWGNTGGGLYAATGSSTTLVDNVPGFLFGPGAAVVASPGAVETTGTTAFLLNSTANYAAFSFVNESTGVVNYGWAQLSLGASYTGVDRAVIAYAYDNTGAAITVGGAVPEPSTYAFMLGGLGLLALQRLRRRGR